MLHGIDLAVRAGEVTALLGPNGAGKTTALSVLSGLKRPTAGCRHLCGRHVNEARSDELARSGVSHVREGRAVFPNLSVSDNLAVSTSTGTSRDRLEQVAFTLFPRLADRRHQLAGTMSGGERQMLALARALGTDPAVLMVDELSMGLAPKVVDELYAAVAKVAGLGVAVLIVEQFATIGLRHAHRALVMAHGSLIYSGSCQGASAAIESAYLGAST